MDETDELLGSPPKQSVSVLNPLLTAYRIHVILTTAGYKLALQNTTILNIWDAPFTSKNYLLRQNSNWTYDRRISKYYFDILYIT